MKRHVTDQAPSGETSLPKSGREIYCLNGVAYLAGTLLIAWPGVTQTVFRDSAFAGHEEALMRVIGLTVAVLALYFWRSFWRPAIRRRLRGRQIGIRAFGADTLGDSRRVPPPLHYVHAAGRIPRHRGVGATLSRMNVRSQVSS